MNSKQNKGTKVYHMHVPMTYINTKKTEMKRGKPSLLTVAFKANHNPTSILNCILAKINLFQSCF